MIVTSKDIIFVNLDENEFNQCVDTAKHLTSHILDRPDLHSRDYLERFTNVLTGEIAEQMVIKWLNGNGKYAESAVDKTSSTPDLGHDILLRLKENNEEIKCSVKSSLSVFKLEDEIVSNFTLATTSREVRQVNIQVYFWLDIYGRGNEDGSRRNIPNLKSAAIIAWASKKDLTTFDRYSTEARLAPKKKLNELRTLNSLLSYIK